MPEKCLVVPSAQAFLKCLALSHLDIVQKAKDVVDLFAVKPQRSETTLIGAKPKRIGQTWGPISGPISIEEQLNHVIHVFEQPEGE